MDTSTITNFLLKVWNSVWGFVGKLLGITDPLSAQVVTAIIIIVLLYLWEPWKKDK